jgi:hypothetical protein
MKKQAPTWHREAIEKEIDYIVLVYEKAEGFVFCPSNLEAPFRIGGDYYGSFPTNALGALEYLNTSLNKAYSDHVSWIIEFIHKILDNKDFSIDDLLIETRTVKTIKGRWPW